MAVEIERKFLIADRVPFHDTPPLKVRQGYLVRGDVEEARIRQEGDVYSLTVKKGIGLAREEFEVVIDSRRFDVLWPATEGARVTKTRRLLALESGHVACVDEFEGHLEGLVTVEVEFGSKEAALAFAPPSWFGLEVTGVRGYANSVLCTQGVPK
ncbi:CYTH domain-containing protein [Streptomyces sp. NPDC048258]|uniref:CYTH domain-containing protein n=1 Tax=Streptomyces sp. NPDC048258 TaxID=3365527 RepID=UPI00371D64E3